MRTAPITKLKGDLFLELKEIKLEIVKATSKLDATQRKIIELNKVFSEREDKIHKRENVNKILEKKFNSIADGADLYLDKIKKEIVVNKKEFAKIDSKKKKIGLNIVSLKEKESSRIKQIEKEIENKTKFNKSLNKTILENKLILDKLENKNKKLSESNSIIHKDSEDVSAKLSKREILIKEREIKNEVTKSELGIWAFRLHEKYGRKMNDIEKKLIKIDT